MNYQTEAIGNKPLYQAIGWVKGELVSLGSDPTRYELLTAEGSDRLRVLGINSRLRKWLQNHDERTGYWAMYPRTDRDGQLKVFLSNKPAQQPDWEDGQFNITGKVVWQDAGSGIIAVRIERNSEPPSPEQAKFWRPFAITLQGYLPDKAVGQWWKLVCLRSGQTLEIVEGDRLTRLPKPTKKQKLAGLTPSQAPSRPGLPASKSAR